MKMLGRLLVTATLFFSITAMSAVGGQDTHKTLSSKEARALIATAKTPEDYEKVAAYFNQKAATLEAEAREHKDIANAYHRGKSPVMQNAELCDKAAAEETKAAQEDRAIAENYQTMAKTASESQ